MKSLWRAGRPAAEAQADMMQVQYVSETGHAPYFFERVPQEQEADIDPLL